MEHDRRRHPLACLVPVRLRNPLQVLGLELLCAWKAAWQGSAIHQQEGSSKRLRVQGDTLYMQQNQTYFVRGVVSVLFDVFSAITGAKNTLGGRPATNCWSPAHASALLCTHPSHPLASVPQRAVV